MATASGLKHPDLARYSPEHVHPRLLAGRPGDVLEEVAPFVFEFPLFSPDYCRKVLEEAEHTGRWVSEADVDRHWPRIHGGPNDTVPETAKLHACRIYPAAEDTPCDPEPFSATALSFAGLPGLTAAYREIVERHALPVFRAVWPGLETYMRRHPYIIRYDAHDAALPKSMISHYDQSVVALTAYLNEDFDGGGTVFPRWKATTGRRGAGWAAFYPGGVSHEHGGAPITRGRRYVLICPQY